MRVLGVDPGLTRCGLGVVDGTPGRAPQLVAAEVVRSAPSAAVGDRLLAVERAVRDFIERHDPDVVAVERVFSQHNVRTVMGTAQAGAMSIAAAARAGRSVALYTPSEVKAAVTGSGNAGKGQIAAMMSRLLRLDCSLPPDVADALALAVCHIWRGAQAERIAGRAAQVAGSRG